MTPFGYTILGFGSGGSPPVPIAEDLSFSEEQIAASQARNFYMKIDPFNANKCLFAWMDSGNNMVIAAATFDDDGTNFSLGTEVEIGSIYAQSPCITFDPNTENSVVVTWQDYHASGGVPARIYHAAVACTLSGTTITAGTTTNISTVEAKDYISDTKCIFNPNRAGQCVVIEMNYDNKDTNVEGALEAQSLTISGTGITQNSMYEISDNGGSGRIYSIGMCWDGDTTSDRFYATYYAGDHNFIAACSIAADNTITIEDVDQHNTSAGRWPQSGAAGDPNTGGRVVVVYNKADQTDVYVKVGNYSGGSWTWGTEVIVQDLAWAVFTFPVKVKMDVNTPDKVLIVMSSEETSRKYCAVVGTLSSTDTITLGTEEVVYDYKVGIRDLAQDPHRHGRFWAAVTGASEYPWVIGHQVASFE